jgi:hypothetical protein
MIASEFKPDWEETWTAAEAEHELDGFKFDGPGWYLTKTDAMLVVPCGRLAANQWHQKGTEKESFRFYIYNGRHPGDAFNAIANAPVRLDEELTVPGFIEDAYGVLPFGHSLHDLD